MAWCRQAPSHYLSQCWHRSMASLGHNELKPEHFQMHYLCRHMASLGHNELRPIRIKSQPAPYHKHFNMNFIFKCFYDKDWMTDLQSHRTDIIWTKKFKFLKLQRCQNEPAWGHIISKLNFHFVGRKISLFIESIIILQPPRVIGQPSALTLFLLTVLHQLISSLCSITGKDMITY